MVAWQRGINQNRLYVPQKDEKEEKPSKPLFFSSPLPASGDQLTQSFPFIFPITINIILPFYHYY